VSSCICEIGLKSTSSSVDPTSPFRFLRSARKSATVRPSDDGFFEVGDPLIADCGVPFGEEDFITEYSLCGWDTDDSRPSIGKRKEYAAYRLRPVMAPMSKATER